MPYSVWPRSAVRGLLCRLDEFRRRTADRRYDNVAARLITNIVRRFADPAPFPPPA
jgi:hypothetical protein